MQKMIQELLSFFFIKYVIYGFVNPRKNAYFMYAQKDTNWM
jgi:hypothetical protein